MPYARTDFWVTISNIITMIWRERTQKSIPWLRYKNKSSIIIYTKRYIIIHIFVHDLWDLWDFRHVMHFFVIITEKKPLFRGSYGTIFFHCFYYHYLWYEIRNFVKLCIIHISICPNICFSSFCLYCIITHIKESILFGLNFYTN